MSRKSNRLLLASAASSMPSALRSFGSSSAACGPRRTNSSSASGEIRRSLAILSKLARSICRISYEIRHMDRANFDSIASDLRISPDALDELVRRGPHAADELPKLLKALGIDEAALANSNRLLLRDMERVCSMCQQKGECDRDLVAGT